MDTTITDKKKYGTRAMATQEGSLLRVGELSAYSVEWSDYQKATPRGGMVYFGHFIYANGLFDGLVESCPLTYTSNNAPDKRNVLGTVVCGIINGAWRYAHLSYLHGDELCAGTLALEGGFVSEDSVRRGFKKGTKTDWDAWDAWLAKAELESILPLLSVPYILDLDTSVKQIYGHQEGAEVGYNPTRRGRPSQSLHVGFIGGLRMLFSVDVQGGKAHAASHMAERVWARIDALPPECRPSLIRGDIAFGNDGYLCSCEDRNLPHLFKLKMTSNVKKQTRKLAQTLSGEDWKAGSGGWEVTESALKLSGWSRERRVVVLRRPFAEGKSKPSDLADWLPGLRFEEAAQKWEYVVLVCSPDLPAATLPKLYAERADCENVLDELKNQWGLAGFSTRDLRRCKVMARLTGVVCNWWNVFARLAEPLEHMEAITSRPELLNLMAVLVTHAGKKVFKVCSQHENAPTVKRAFARLYMVFSRIDAIAGQLDRATIWAIQLSVAFYAWLRGKVLKVPKMAEDVVHQLSLMPPAAPG